MNDTHVCLLVPAVGVQLNGLGIILDAARAVFLEETDHTGGTGATVEPDSKRRVVGVFAGLEEPKPDGLRGREVAIARSLVNT